MAAPPSVPKPGDFPSGGEKPGMIHHPPPRQWIPDQRDAFIAWLRGEFAAANAIIDTLCQHLHLIGAPGEYDFVLAAIQQRRFTWNGVLHMQQYFSVNDVLIALQQALMMRKQLPQQMPNGGVKMPSPSSSPQQPPKGYSPNGGVVAGGGGPRRDSYGNPRRQQERQERPKQRSVLPGTGVPPSDRGLGSKLPENLHEEVEVLEEENFNSASASQLSSPVSSVAQQEDDNNTGNKNSDNAQEHFINENPKREEPLVELGRMKGGEAATVEVVETGQKVNLVEGELYHHVFGGAPLPHLVTEVLDTSSTTADQSCIRGKVHTIPDNQKERPDKKPLSPVPDFVHSIVGYLSRSGALSSSHRPDCFIMNVIEEGKSLTLEEQTLRMQPHYIVALLSDCSISLRKRSDKTDSGGSTLLMPVGSMLKLGTSINPSAYVVNASPKKRVVIFLGVDQHQEKKPSGKATSKQSPNSGSSNCGKSQGGSSYQAWQARPGTGVYIPSSNSSKCDIAMSYRACVQDVR